MQRVIKRAEILGFGVDLLGGQEAVCYVNELIEQKIGAHVVTINPEIIEIGQKNVDFAKILNNAELIIPDGVGIKLALKINGIDQEQIPGIEFSKKLIELANEKGYSVAFLGAQEDVVNRACENLKNEFEGLKICYKRNGFFGIDEETQIIEDIKAANPTILFVALGVPRQEFFIDKYRYELPNTVMIGVGGSFDVWSGKIKRAPVFFRKIGCEWLYRLLKQPSRFSRMFPTLPLFLVRVIIEKCRCKHKK